MEILDQQEQQDQLEDKMRQDGTSTNTQTPSSSTTEGVEIWEEQYPQGQVPENLPPEFDCLTERQKLFVIYYAITRKGVEAVKMAGYEGTYDSMRVKASRLLTNANILQAFDAYMRPVFEKHGVTISRIIEHWADLAFAPWGDYVVVKEKKGRIVSVFMPLSAKVKALENLSKMVKLIGDKDGELSNYIDQSQHVHLHKYTNADEAREALLDFLRKRK